MEYVIRASNKKDVYEVTHVVTICWNETYKGLVPDEYLENLKLDEDERAKRTIENFENHKYKQLVLEVDGKIVGFIRYGKSDDQEFNNCGEIYAFYIINKYHGLGLGRKLFELARDNLKKDGFDKMIIACLKGNTTNSFYEHMGGIYIKDGIFEKLKLKENIFYYDI